MANYNELRAKVEKQYRDAWAPHPSRIAMRNVAPAPVVPPREELMQSAYAHAWNQYQQKAVCDGAAELPDSDLDKSPLVFSKTHTAIPNIGGILSENTDGFPVTDEAVKSHREGSWVLVQLHGKYVAMTLDQAFRRALTEAAWPTKN